MSVWEGFVLHISILAKKERKGGEGVKKDKALSVSSEKTETEWTIMEVGRIIIGRITMVLLRLDLLLWMD